MPTIILALLVLGALTAAAVWIANLKNITVRDLYGGVIILNLLDYLTTMVGVKLLGKRELNLVIAHLLESDIAFICFLFAKLILPTLLFVLGAIRLEQWEKRKKRRGRTAIAFSLLLLFCTVLSNGISLLVVLFN
ncbi:MAG: hypothetical protein A2939_01975 [Parcubacteria group bacterium RIFCSPLOWO2_01_FULL_48_18]|nr:MAG: hypothetical protein A2939_01975 [Parcubacteria group bacterium RIFCSPLOWO2_01_FULL_48_18]